MVKIHLALPLSMHSRTQSGFLIEYCTAIAVLVTGVTLIYIYCTSTGRSTLTAVTLTCDTRDRFYGLRVQLRTLPVIQLTDRSFMHLMYSNLTYFSQHFTLEFVVSAGLIFYKKKMVPSHLMIKC